MEDIKKQIDFWKEKALKDNLTKLYNRNAFDIVVEDLENIGHFAIVDIDHFKSVNDEYGHDVGDAVLKQLAEILEEETIVFRWGGEEFIIILPEGDAQEFLDDLRKKIAGTKFPEVDYITVSIGHTEFSSSKYVNSIFKEADNALYCAKEGGRNQVIKYEDGMDCAAHNDDGKNLDKNKECKKEKLESKIELVAGAKEVSIDLDGTIIEDRFPEFGKTIEKNVEQMRELKEKGYRLVILSARISGNPSWKKKIEKMLKERDIPFDKITNKKPHTTSAFIDDRNLCVPYNEEWSSNMADKIEKLVKDHKTKSVKSREIGVAPSADTPQELEIYKEQLSKLVMDPEYSNIIKDLVLTLQDPDKKYPTHNLDLAVSEIFQEQDIFRESGLADKKKDYRKPAQ